MELESSEEQIESVVTGFSWNVELDCPNIALLLSLWDFPLATVTSIPQSGNNLVQGSISGIERSGTGSGIEMLSVRCVAQSLNFIPEGSFPNGSE
jgi:hypothetical protein